MGLIIQQKALRAAGGLRQVLPVVRKRDRSLFDRIHRAMQAFAWGRRGGERGSALRASRLTQGDRRKVFRGGVNPSFAPRRPHASS